MSPSTKTTLRIKPFPSLARTKQRVVGTRQALWSGPSCRRSFTRWNRPVGRQRHYEPEKCLRERRRRRPWLRQFRIEMPGTRRDDRMVQRARPMQEILRRCHHLPRGVGGVREVVHPILPVDFLGKYCPGFRSAHVPAAPVSRQDHSVTHPIDRSFDVARHNCASRLPPNFVNVVVTGVGEVVGAG